MGLISVLSMTAVPLPLPPIVISADYTYQLNKIVDLLSRPTVPSWQVAILGTLVGAVVGILAEPAKVFLVSTFKRRKLERRLISDVINAYTGIRIYHLPLLDSRLKSKNDDVQQYYEWLCSDLQRDIHADAFEHALKDPELLYDLSSSHALRSLYAVMTDLRAGKKYIDAFNTASLYSKLHLFLYLVERSIADASINVRLLPKHLPTATKERLQGVAQGRIKPHWQDEVKTHP